jgi:hypothetical protein
MVLACVGMKEFDRRLHENCDNLWLWLFVTLGINQGEPLGAAD